MTHWRPDGLMSEVIAGLTGATLFSMFVLFAVMATRMRDEFGRALLLRSLLAGLLGTMFVAFVWGYVETFSRTPVTHLPVLVVPAIFVLLTAAAKLIVFRRHRAGAEEQLA
ncbi:MAG TPA: hypothetical protein VKV02_02915 [Acidobacteriaceae bacterium]|nr:hypothetical protein [Acidobacteriaceae bacterium]